MGDRNGENVERGRQRVRALRPRATSCCRSVAKKDGHTAATMRLSAAGRAAVRGLSIGCSGVYSRRSRRAMMICDIHLTKKPQALHSGMTARIRNRSGQLVMRCQLSPIGPEVVEHVLKLVETESGS
jgi:hypothetical protein